MPEYVDETGETVQVPVVGPAEMPPPPTNPGGTPGPCGSKYDAVAAASHDYDVARAAAAAAAEYYCSKLDDLCACLRSSAGA